MLRRALSVLLFAIAMCFSQQISANHILGGNVTMECLGGDTYGVTLTIYKDCFGATAAPNTESVFILPSGCAGVLPFSINTNLQSVTEISELCPTEAVNSSCAGGALPGAQALIYYVEVNLDPSCIWTVEYTQGDWNYFINIDFSSLPTALIQTQIDPSLGCNSSISIDPMGQIPYSCLGDPVSHQMVVNNPNGYDLTYSLVCPQIPGGVDVPLFNPCDEPIPGITIDPATGELNFTSPMVPGNYVVGVVIEMSSGGVVFGTG
ncbi:MAG: hypothetical protein HRT74_03300, partial [Flavobacteriales bacterium]|nr:hypothetical protein [Flavobacteriales bacterium]